MRAQPPSRAGLTDTVETIANKVVSGELKMSSDEDEEGGEEAPPEANAVPAAASAHVDVPTATVVSGSGDASSVTEGLEKLSTGDE